MGDIAGYTTIKKIVYAYADEAMQNSSTFRRLYSIALRGVTDLAMDVIGQVKSCRLCVQPNKTVELPEDYLNWSKVGVLNDCGEVATLNNNPSMTLNGATSVNRLSQNIDSSTPDYGNIGYGLYLNFVDEWYGYYGVNLFGISGNEAASLGSFKVDHDCGLILLNNDFRYDYIILEYISLPDEDTKIPIQAQEALIAWLAWKDIIDLAASRKVSVYDKTERKRSYFREKNNARNRLKPFRISEAYNVTQQAIRLVPKG